MEEFYDLCLYIIDCYVQTNLIDYYKELHNKRFGGDIDKNFAIQFPN